MSGFGGFQRLLASKHGRRLGINREGVPSFLYEFFDLSHYIPQRLKHLIHIESQMSNFHGMHHPGDLFGNLSNDGTGSMANATCVP